MKTMALLFLLTASVVVASAQSPHINQPAAPVTIRYARAVEFLVCYEGVGGDNGAPPWHDRFNGPDTAVLYGGSNAAASPEDFTSNQAAFLAQMENLKRSPKVSSKAFFSIAIINTGSKPIKGLTFQFLFTSLATGAHYASYEKHVRIKLKPGEEKWLTPTVSLKKAPPELPQAINSGGVKDETQLLRVEYADGSVWSRP